MKVLKIVSAILFLSSFGIASAQSDSMNGMKHTGMPKQEANATRNSAVHTASGVVKSVNAEKGVVTFAHGPVASLNWPPMTMGFVVNDGKLFDKLATGKKVDFEFIQQGSAYIVTAVK